MFKSESVTGHCRKGVGGGGGGGREEGTRSERGEGEKYKEEREGGEPEERGSVSIPPAMRYVLGKAFFACISARACPLWNRSNTPSEYTLTGSGEGERGREGGRRDRGIEGRRTATKGRGSLTLVSCASPRFTGWHTRLVSVEVHITLTHLCMFTHPSLPTCRAMFSLFHSDTFPLSLWGRNFS